MLIRFWGGLTGVINLSKSNMDGFSEAEVLKRAEIKEGKKATMFKPLCFGSQQLSKSSSDGLFRSCNRAILRSEAYQEANQNWMVG